MIQKVKTSDLKLSDNNPRFIRDDKFKKLVASIKEFPEMLEKRPLIVDENNVILGGNMRYRACLELKIKEVPVIVASGWTQEQKDQFQIKDNITFGEWDFEVLANVYEVKDLIDWGMDSYSFGTAGMNLHVSEMLDDEEEEEEGSSESTALPIDKESPKITDDGFARFEIIIPESEKRFIVDLIAQVAEKNKSTTGSAFVQIFKAYKS